MRVFGVLCAVAATASVASGQAGLFLVPDAYTTSTGVPFAISVRQGHAASWNESNWPNPVDWLFVRAAGAQTNMGAGDAPKPDARGRAALTIDHAGVAMIGMELAPTDSDWAPAVVREFAARANREDPCLTAPMPVRYVRSAVTLIHATDAAGGAGTDSSATSKAGLQVEIRPLMDPTRMQPGGDIPMRVYLEGDAAAGGTVHATHMPTGRTQRVKADAKGIAPLRIDAAGEWRLEFHEFRKARAEGEAALAASATLTFEVPAVEAPVEPEAKKTEGTP